MKTLKLIKKIEIESNLIVSISEGECTPWRLNYTNCDQLCCNEEGNSVYLRDCVKLNQDTPDRDTIRLEPCSGECCSEIFFS